MKTTLSLVMSSLLLVAAPAWSANDMGQMSAPSAASAATAANAATTTDGEVKKIDVENKKLTIKHGEIKNLGMPGMTMVFQVSDPAFLEKVKSGDKVRFTAEKVNGAFTVTSIEAAK